MSRPVAHQSAPRLRTGLLPILLLCLSSLPAHAATSPSPVGAIPERGLAGARALLIARVGGDFFAKYLTLDSTATRYWPNCEAGYPRKARPPTRREGVAPEQQAPAPVAAHSPCWSLSYRLRMATKPWVGGSVSLDVDSTGALVGTGGIRGIADCVNHPEACTFAVDRATAIEAAKRAGFEAGRTPWEVLFAWVSGIPVPSYHWTIKNMTKLEADSCSGEGRIMVIHSGTGEVLTTQMWGRNCDFAPDPNALPAEEEFVYYEEAPVPIRQPQPVWPDITGEKPIEGTIVLHVLVGKDGTVKDIKIIKGAQGMDAAVMDVVRRWVYKPALSNNKPVAVWITVPYHFRL